MGDFTTTVNNFTGGKVSQKFRGRFDLSIYANSLEEFNNFFMGKIGGAYKRTGTVRVQSPATAGDLSETHSVLTFDSGRDRSYLVFLPNATVKLDGLLFNEIYITPNINNWFSSAPTYDLGSGITARLGSGLPAWPSSVNTPFSSGVWVSQQVGDLLFITHSSGEQRPLVITRTGSATFEINYYDSYQTQAENLSLVLRVPYRAPNISSITMTISGSTMTAGASYFTAGMVGSLFKIRDGSEDSVVVITAVASGTSATVSYLIGTQPTAATDNWQQSAWCDEFGWPTSVTYHDQRLFWGGNLKDYDTVWGSLVGNLLHMMRRRLVQDSSSDSSGINYFGDVSVASDPFDFKPASTYANSTTWLSGGRVLMVGTSGGENIVNIGVEQISSVENSNYGSINTNIVKAGKDVMFVGKDGRTIRTYRFSDDNGSWLSDDLSSKAEDSFFDGEKGSDPYPVIKQLAWNPDTKQLWCVLDNNLVKVLSYDPEYGMAGWQDFTLGGASQDKVTGVVTLPSPDRDSFETYLTVSRYEAGNDANRTYVEKIIGEYRNTTLASATSSDITDYPRYLDFASFEDADANGKVSFLVDFLGNVFDAFFTDGTTFGVVYGKEVVSDGSGGYELDHTFPANAKVLIGYKYDAELKLLPLDAGGVLGTAISDLKDISRVYLKLFRTAQLKIGSKDQRSKLDLSFENVTYDDLTTEEKEIQFFDNPDSEESVIVRSDTALPLNILAMVMKGDSKR